MICIHRDGALSQTFTWISDICDISSRFNWFLLHIDTRIDWVREDRFVYEQKWVQH